ncbi:MAG: hypothetical protein QMC35_10105 [Polaribacter sp.]|jgi:hypothetical protein
MEKYSDSSDSQNQVMEDKIGENIKKLKDIFPNYIAEKSRKSHKEDGEVNYNKLFDTLGKIPEMLLKGDLETVHYDALQELAGDLGYDGNFQITNLESFNTILIDLHTLAAVPMGNISLSFGAETTLSGSISDNSEDDSTISTLTEASSSSHNNAISPDKDLNINNSTSSSVKKEEEKKLIKQLTFTITLKGKDKEPKIIPFEFENIPPKEAINKVVESIKKECIEGYNKTEIPYHPELVGLLAALKDKLGSKSVITITISEQWLNNIENNPNIKAILQDYERADKKVFLNKSDEIKYNELLTKYEVKPSSSDHDLNNLSIPSNKWNAGVKPPTKKQDLKPAIPTRRMSK